MSDEIRNEYKQESQMRIVNGWLIPYSQERLRPSKGPNPLTAVVQPSKGNVHQVMNYRELNEHLDAFTMDVDIYSTNLREWCPQGVNLALLELQ